MATRGKREGNYKAGPGRPTGTKKYPLRESIRLNEEQKQHLIDKYGGVSYGIHFLIDADIAAAAHEETGKAE